MSSASCRRYFPNIPCIKNIFKKNHMKNLNNGYTHGDCHASSTTVLSILERLCLITFFAKLLYRIIGIQITEQASPSPKNQGHGIYDMTYRLSNHGP